MSTDPTDWHQVLAHVTGALVRGEQRVSTQELFSKLGVPITDPASRRLERVMHDLGWRGPKLIRWGEETTRGYWRHPTVGLPAIAASAGMQEEPVAEIEKPGEEGSLAPELEWVTGLALQKLDQILRIPTDRGDGNLLRAQTAAAGIAVNAQLKADETKMKQARRGDVLERLLKLMAEEKAKLAERRKGGEREGPAGACADIVGPSTCAEDSGINITPAQDASDRSRRPDQLLHFRPAGGGWPCITKETTENSGEREELRLRNCLQKADSPPAVLMIDALTGNEVTRVPTGPSFRSRFKYPYIIIHRIDLHNVLLDACQRDPLITLARFDDSVTVTTEDGRSFEGVALISSGPLSCEIRAPVSPQTAE
jgi:hypothetical protein